MTLPSLVVILSAVDSLLTSEPVPTPFPIVISLAAAAQLSRLTSATRPFPSGRLLIASEFYPPSDLVTMLMFSVGLRPRAFEGPPSQRCVPPIEKRRLFRVPRFGVMAMLLGLTVTPP